WILGAGKPVGQRIQTILTPHALLRSKKLGSGRLARAGVLHFAFAVDVDNLLAVELVLVVAIPPVVFQHLVLHAGENAGPAIVIVLRPAIERVVMALGALQPNAEEELSRSFCPR